MGQDVPTTGRLMASPSYDLLQWPTAGGYVRALKGRWTLRDLVNFESLVGDARTPDEKAMQEAVKGLEGAEARRVGRPQSDPCGVQESARQQVACAKAMQRRDTQRAMEAAGAALRKVMTLGRRTTR